MQDLELLLILGLGGVIAYSAYKAKQAAQLAIPDWLKAAQQAYTNLETRAGGAISPGLMMFLVGSGTTDNGNHWTVYQNQQAVMNVNGIDVGLSDQIGPGGQTAQQLLQDEWTNADIADYVVMSGVIPVQAIQEGAKQGLPTDGVITWDPTKYM
jgi:hypothetical protein